MSISQEYLERDLSGSQGLAMLRDAATTGDLQTFEKVLTEVFARRGFWQRFLRLLEIHFAICSNYDSIIEIANEIINDPNSSSADVEWARMKREEAVAGKQQQGCAAGTVG